MKTPKEKAIELIKKYSTYLPYYSEKDNKNKSKQCALISVEFAREFITGDLSERFDKTMYLLEVKEEIEKL